MGMMKMAYQTMLTFSKTLKKIGKNMKTIRYMKMGIFFRLTMMPCRINMLGKVLTVTIITLALQEILVQMVMFPIYGMCGILLYSTNIMDKDMLPFMLL